MRAGEIVAERFRIERVAARGASGVVLSAIDETSGARVALKLLLGELEEAALSRFDVETAALQRLAHPAVVRYVAHGRLEGNGAYLAMEWVDGGSLSQRLRSRGLPGRASLGIASTLAEGLAAAHAAGIVHRDVKPGNVLLTKSDISAAKLADFGIARLGLGSTVTSAGTWVGTPRYMPPEQVRDARKVDGRADVFALGCVLFECLTGRNAFPGDDAATTLARILLHERVRLSTVRPDLPAELSTLLAAMLAREARDRPDAAEVVAALRRLIERDDASLELEAPTLGSVHEQAPTLGARTILEVARTLEPERGGIDDAAGTPPDDAAGASDAMDPSDPSVTPTAPRATATRTPGRRVPPPETPTIGRETELAALGRALFATDPSDSSGALVLWGGPGIGKTRLAIELAQLATGETALCDLGEARDAPAMLDAIARTLDRPRTRGATLGSLLSETRLDLLILDRADHVAAELARALGAARAANASRQARAALPKLIVTSRVRIRSTTISAHEVLPLSVTAGTGDVGGNSERSAAGALSTSTRAPTSTTPAGRRARRAPPSRSDRRRSRRSHARSTACRSRSSSPRRTWGCSASRGSCGGACDRWSWWGATSRRRDERQADRAQKGSREARPTRTSRWRRRSGGRGARSAPTRPRSPRGARCCAGRSAPSTPRRSRRRRGGQEGRSPRCAGCAIARCSRGRGRRARRGSRCTARSAISPSRGWSSAESSPTRGRGTRSTSRAGRRRSRRRCWRGPTRRRRAR
jgi:serine/threonine protein kinase